MDLTANWHSKNLGSFASVQIDVALVPGVPDGHVVIAMAPGHLEHAKAALLEYLHPVAFDRDLAVAGLGPGLQQLFSVFLPHDHEIQGLAGPEIAYGHLV